MEISGSPKREQTTSYSRLSASAFLVTIDLNALNGVFKMKSTEFGEDFPPRKDESSGQEGR
jgi:hypothetical protein